jgi:hypothetical protein
MVIKSVKPISRAWLTRHPEDGGSKHLWNVIEFLPDYTVQNPKGRSFDTRHRKNLNSHLANYFRHGSTGNFGICLF